MYGDDNVIGSIAACGAASLGSRPGCLPTYILDPSEKISRNLESQIEKILNIGWTNLIFLPDLHFGYDFLKLS